jgi:hypothetical protein
MTAAREAIYLPVLFLSVALAGGLRPGAPRVLPPPSLFSLVLAVLLIGALVQSGALAPLRVMNTFRGALANVNGFTLLTALFVASAQVFSLLTPAAGLPSILFSVYFLVLMFNTLAAGPDRVRVLRSLAVTFGAAFVLKFIVLNALSDPAAGRMARVLQLLFEGVTLGTLTQELQHPAAGYLAFFTIAIFLIGLSLLPGDAIAARDTAITRKDMAIAFEDTKTIQPQSTQRRRNDLDSS